MGKKIYYLIRGVLNSFNSIILTLIIIVSCSAILFLYNINIYSGKINEINDVKDTYGNYHFKVNSDSDVLNYIETRVKVDNLYSSQEYSKLINGQEYLFINITKEWLESSEYKLVQGRIPDNENEVVVEKWYLYMCGYSQDEMIGAQITIPNPFTGDDEKKTVTGLVAEISSGNISNYDCGTILCGEVLNKGNMSETLYVRLSDIDDVYDVTEGIKQETGISEDELGIVYNNELLYVSGVSEDGRTESHRMYILSIIIDVILIMVAFITIFNSLRLFLDKARNEVYIFNLIGVPEVKLAIFIDIVFLLFIVVGILIGSIAGYVGGKILCEFLGEILYIPWKKYVYMCLLEIVVLAPAILLRVYIVMKRAGISKLGDSNDLRILGCDISVRSMFNSTYLANAKIMVRNIRMNYQKKLIAIIMGIVTIIMISMIFAQTREQLRYTDDNYEYRYRIEFDNGVYRENKDEVATIYEEVKKILNDYGCNFYIEECDFVYAKFDKEELSRELKDIISRDMDQMIKLNNKYTDEIELPVITMGYSKEMLDELCEKYNIDKISDGEAIILNRSVNRDNTFSGELNIDGVKKINATTSVVAYEDEKRIDFETQEISVVGAVDELPVYPSEKGNYLVMVMEESYFDYYFRLMEFPEKIYLGDIGEEVINSIATLGTGNNYLSIVDQFDEISDARISYYKKVIGYLCVAVYAAFFAVFNGILITNMELSLKSRDFLIYYKLGIRKLRLILIQILEVVLIDCAAIIMGIIIAVGIIQRLANLNYIYNTQITGVEITAIIVVGLLLTGTKVITILKNMLSQKMGTEAD